MSNYLDLGGSWYGLWDRRPPRTTKSRGMIALQPGAMRSLGDEVVAPGLSYIVTRESAGSARAAIRQA